MCMSFTKVGEINRSKETNINTTMIMVAITDIHAYLLYSLSHESICNRRIREFGVSRFFFKSFDTYNAINK